jgi:hypothetical protein
MGVFQSCMGFVVEGSECGNEWRWWMMFLWRMLGDVGSEWGCCLSAWGLLY